MPHAGHSWTQPNHGDVKNKYSSTSIVSIHVLVILRTHPANITTPKMIRNAASVAMSTGCVAAARTESSLRTVVDSEGWLRHGGFGKSAPTSSVYGCGHEVANER